MITPTKASPAVAEDSRELNPQEMKFYKSTLDHYVGRCKADPCNRGLRSQMKMYEGIVSSGRIGTLAAYAGNSD